MVFKKCPLCSGTVSKGRCIDCGYYIPDEGELENMSSLYDFDPDNYPEPVKYTAQVEEMGTGEAYAPPIADTPPKVEVGHFGDPGKLPAAPPQPAVPPPNAGQNTGNAKKISFSTADIRKEFIIHLIFSIITPVPIVGIILGIRILFMAQNRKEAIVGILCVLLSFLR